MDLTILVIGIILVSLLSFGFSQFLGKNKKRKKGWRLDLILSLFLFLIGSIFSVTLINLLSDPNTSTSTETSDFGFLIGGIPVNADLMFYIPIFALPILAPLGLYLLIKTIIRRMNGDKSGHYL